MACLAGARRHLCSAQKLFLFVNVAFAVYSGALLATGARLAWDPSTYSWFRFLCAAQYRATCAYTAAAGVWLLALVLVGAAGGAHSLYQAGVAVLALSELVYGAWMAASLAAWWRDSPRAELARRGVDLLHDLKPALLAVERYRDVVRPLLDMLEEVEREAPNNLYVVLVFAALGLLLQVAALVLARRVARRPPPPPHPHPLAEKAAADEDSDDATPSLPPSPPAWRTSANLRMYTILDKIF